MKIAPLQPKGIAFEEVSISCEFNDDGLPIQAIDFDFENVRLSCEVGHTEYEEDATTPTGDSLLVSVRLRIENVDGKKAPYRVNIAVSGLFKWLNKQTPPELRRDLMVVNGATILYGSIREMTLTLTSRYVSGPMLLPAVNFEDNKPSITDQQAARQRSLELPEGSAK
jgi:preprotein translocase subunit SecB